MIKHNITYTNYSGQKVTTTEYFHLTKLDLVKMTANFKINGNTVEVDKYLNYLLEKEDLDELIKVMEMFICKAHGRRSLEDDRFIKSHNFDETLAYAEMFESFFNNPKEFEAFVEGLVAPLGGSNTTNHKQALLDQITNNQAARPVLVEKDVVVDQPSENDDEIKALEARLKELKK